MKNIDEKIRKIVALIDGAATEGEARAASLALQRLLVANSLKLEDINLDDSPCPLLLSAAGLCARYACLFGMGHSAVGVVLGVGLCVAVWAGTSEVQ